MTIKLPYYTFISHITKKLTINYKIIIISLLHVNFLTVKDVFKTNIVQMI